MVESYVLDLYSGAWTKTANEVQLQLQQLEGHVESK